MSDVAQADHYQHERNPWTVTVAGGQPVPVVDLRHIDRHPIGLALVEALRAARARGQTPQVIHHDIALLDITDHIYGVRCVRHEDAPQSWFEVVTDQDLARQGGLRFYAQPEFLREVNQAMGVIEERGEAPTVIRHNIDGLTGLPASLQVWGLPLEHHDGCEPGAWRVVSRRDVDAERSGRRPIMAGWIRRLRSGASV